MTAPKTAHSAYFSLHPQLQKNIVQQLGWRSLRPVQEASIPPLLQGHDAVILAPTAGGKTESALFPLLSRVLEDNPGEGPNILYLCPLKALINNLLPRLQELARLASRDAFAWHGEVSQSARSGFLKEPQTILLTTPESLQVILTRKNIDPKELFGQLQAVIIDEVHAFCGDDRGDQLSALLHQLDHYTGRKIQRVGLSATVGNPEHLLEWLAGGRDTQRSLVDPGETVRQQKLLEVHPIGKDMDSCARVLARLMGDTAKSLLFLDSRRQVELAQSALSKLGIEAHTHHSSLSQTMRENAESVFRNQGRVKAPQAIVCTSTLELGLDVGDVGKVFQLGAPSTVSAFLQRLGRAGRRADSMAHMVFVTDEEQSFLRALALIQLAIKRQVEPVLPDTRNFEVLVQQMLLSVLASDGLARHKLWERIGNPPPFQDISQDEKEEVLEQLLTLDYLQVQDSLLLLGDRTEAEFGRSHFLDLLSVFQGGSSIKVQSVSGEVVGNIDYGVAQTMQQTKKSFLLGGRSWKVKSWDKHGKTLTVVPSSGGEPLRWSGSREDYTDTLVRQIKELLTDTAPLPFLGQRAQKRLGELRELNTHLCEDAVTYTERSKPNPLVAFEQWAGARVHRTLGAAVAGWLGTEFSYDDQSWRVEASFAQVQALWASCRDWDQFVEGGLELYKGKNTQQISPGKFHHLLPPQIQKERINKKLYDVVGAQKYWEELARAVPLQRS